MAGGRWFECYVNKYDNVNKYACSFADGAKGDFSGSVITKSSGNGRPKPGDIVLSYYDSRKFCFRGTVAKDNGNSFLIAFDDGESHDMNQSMVFKFVPLSCC